MHPGPIAAWLLWDLKARTKLGIRDIGDAELLGYLLRRPLPNHGEQLFACDLLPPHAISTRHVIVEIDWTAELLVVQEDRRPSCHPVCNPDHRIRGLRPDVMVTVVEHEVIGAIAKHEQERALRSQTDELAILETNESRKAASE